jgi:hypothetical protein
MSSLDSALTHVREHPYFWCNLLSVCWLTLLGAWLLDRPSFRLSIVAGLMNAPCFVFLALLEDTYWNPVRLLPFRLDASDVLCSYAVAAMAWFALTLFQRMQLEAHFAWRPFLLRYHLVAGLSVGCFLASYAAGLEGMTSLLVACFVVTAFLFAVLKEMRGLALEGAVRFAVLYLVVVKIYFLLWPGFVSQWNPAAPWGILIGGIPLGEIVWASLFGAYWTLFMSFVFRLRPSEKSGITMMKH